MVVFSASITAYLMRAAKAEGEIRIRADGSVEPPSAAISTADKITYVLVEDINNSIIVERDNIVIDGEGHVIQGTHTESIGITLIGRSNVTIRHVTVKAFWCDIYLENSSNCQISECIVTDTSSVGILLDGFSTFNRIDLNNVSYNWNGGIRIGDSSDFNDVCSNNVTENYLAISISGSANNTLEENNITMNRLGVSIEFSSNTMISENRIVNGYRDAFGIYLASSANNTIVGNTITNSSDGLVMFWSSQNVVFRNIIIQNYYGGIYLRESSGNTICENIVSDNEGNSGISVSYCSNNSIYHNSFINNGPRVYGNTSGYVNFWDNGYPDGGNYWSSHIDPDVFKGESQNEAGSDGIVDESYVVDAENVDRYPLTKSYGGVYDVGVRVSASRTIVAVGYNVTVGINVTVINYGLRTESFRFMFHVYGIDYDENLTLESRHSGKFVFSLDTTGLARGNYTIWADVDSVPNETAVSDNTFSGKIMITIVGDIAPAYGVVDIFDVVRVALSFGLSCNDPNWNPDVDINDDQVIDIFDMVAVAIHFGITS